MEYLRLGRTGLQASIMGLGAGGHSRLGRKTGKSPEESTAVVKKAIELGINFIDTAERYGTEQLVGEAIAGYPRENLILSTKKALKPDGALITGQQLRSGLETSLRNLGTDYVDVYHLHGVLPEEYAYVCEELLPAMDKARSQGMIRFFGITEMFAVDPQHHMLMKALDDNVWDVIMVGYNMLNQSAAERVFPKTIAKDVGVLIMFAVRRALRSPVDLQDALDDMASKGWQPPMSVTASIIEETLRSSAADIRDAAYRFCRHQKGVHVTLSGTGSVEHLVENYKSLMAPPLPPSIHQYLESLFAGIDWVSGN